MLSPKTSALAASTPSLLCISWSSSLLRTISSSRSIVALHRGVEQRKNLRRHFVFGLLGYGHVESGVALVILAVRGTTQQTS